MNKIIYFLFVSFFFNFSIKNTFAGEAENIYNEKRIEHILNTSNFSKFYFEVKEDELSNFSNKDFTKIKINNKYGLIDKNMNFIIKPKYESLHIQNNNNLVGFKTENSQGFLNAKNGKEIKEYKLESNYLFILKDFTNGLVSIIELNNSVYNGTKCGYINEKGDIVIKPKYKICNNFSENRAFVLEEIDKINKNIISKENEKELEDFDFDFDLPIKYSIINEKGEIIKTLNENGRKVIFNYEYKDGYSIIVLDGVNYGVIDINGNFIIPPIYQEIKDISEDLFVVKNNNKYGYLDRTGKVVIDFNFDYADGFSKGIASVIINNNKFHINKKGNFISLTYKNINYIPSVINGVCCGFMDENNNILIDAKFEKVSYFTIENLCLVKFKNKYGYINKKGKFIIEPIFDEAYDFSNGIAIVKKDNDYHYIDKTGKIITSLSKLKKLVNEGKI
ncbi:MAG: WG repeat-containing protein [Candidatus Sericytochromatia bacterium]